jgi:hypothetical protein
MKIVPENEKMITRSIRMTPAQWAEIDAFATQYGVNYGCVLRRLWEISRDRITEDLKKCDLILKYGQKNG